MRYSEINDPSATYRSFMRFLSGGSARSMRTKFSAELIFPIDNKKDDPNVNRDASSDSIDNVVNFFIKNNDNGIPSNNEDRIRFILTINFKRWLLESGAKESFERSKKEYITSWLMKTDDYTGWDEERAIANILKKQGYSSELINNVMTAQKSDFESDSDKKYIGLYKKAKTLAHKNLVDDKLEDIIGNGWSDVNYRRAYKYFCKFYDHSDLEKDWLNQEDMEMMSGVRNKFNFRWPYDSSIDDNNINTNLTNIAASLQKTTNQRCVISANTASHRGNEWMLFNDPSIGSDDDNNETGVEILSPYMSLPNCIFSLNTFFNWVKINGGYANTSTDFSISVNIPNLKADQINYLKLIMFFGNKDILDSFAQSIFLNVRNSFNVVEDDKLDPSLVFEILSTLKRKIMLLAERSANTLSLQKSDAESEKGVRLSINFKSGDIKIQYNHSDNYIAEISNLQNMLALYPFSLYASTDISAAPNRYLKTIKNLIAQSTSTSGSEIQDSFVEYLIDNISEEQFKTSIASLYQETDTDKNKAQSAAKKPIDLDQPIDSQITDQSVQKG